MALRGDLFGMGRVRDGRGFCWVGFGDVAEGALYWVEFIYCRHWVHTEELNGVFAILSRGDVKTVFLPGGLGYQANEEGGQQSKQMMLPEALLGPDRICSFSAIASIFPKQHLISIQVSPIPPPAPRDHYPSLGSGRALLKLQARCLRQPPRWNPPCQLYSPQLVQLREGQSPPYRTHDTRSSTQHSEPHSAQRPTMASPVHQKACSAARPPLAVPRIPTFNARPCLPTQWSSSSRSRPHGLSSAWVDSTAFCNLVWPSWCPSSIE